LSVAVTIDRISPKEEMARCALELFREKGYKATTIAEIAKSAGFHVQTFYRHFSSKEDLVAEIWRQSYEEFKSRFEARGNQSAIAAWREYIRDTAKRIVADANVWGLDEKSSLPVLTAECQMYQDQYRLLLADGIAQELNVNAKNNIRPMLIACMLFDGNAMAARQWIGKKMNKKAYIDSLLKIVDESKALFDGLK